MTETPISPDNIIVGARRTLKITECTVSATTIVGRVTEITTIIKY